MYRKIISVCSTIWQKVFRPTLCLSKCVNEMLFHLPKIIKIL